MTGRLPSSAIPRLARARDSLRASPIDALVVSHLPNIRYLTGFTGTAGLLVLTPTAVHAPRRLSLPQRGAGAPGVAQRSFVRSGRAGGAAAQLRRGPRGGAERDGRAADRRRGGLDASQPIRQAVASARGLGADAAAEPGWRARCSCRPNASIESGTGGQGRARDCDAAGGRAAPRPTRSARRCSFAQAGRSELEVAADVDALLRRDGFRAPGVRDHRRIGAKQRPAACAAGTAESPGRRRRRAGLWRRLRRILRGFDAYGSARRRRTPTFAGCSPPSRKRSRRPSRRSGRVSQASARRCRSPGGRSTDTD